MADLPGLTEHRFSDSKSVVTAHDCAFELLQRDALAPHTSVLVTVPPLVGARS